jgi:hypothetical protein
LGAWAVVVFRGALSGIQEAIRAFPRQELDSLQAEVAELAASHAELFAKADQLPVTWEEMLRKVRRTEERTRGAVRRARQELEEAGFQSEELEGAWGDLQPLDGTGSETGGLQPLSNGVGSVPQNPSPQPEPDFRSLALARKYGGS